MYTFNNFFYNLLRHCDDKHDSYMTHDSYTTKPRDILSRNPCLSDYMCVTTSKDFTAHIMKMKKIACYKNLL